MHRGDVAPAVLGALLGRWFRRPPDAAPRAAAADPSDDRYPASRQMFQEILRRSPNSGRSLRLRQHEALDGHAFRSNRREECVQMPAKMARSDRLPPIGASTVIAVVRAASLSCHNEGNAPKFSRNGGASGESRFESIQRLRISSRVRSRGWSRFGRNRNGARTGSHGQGSGAPGKPDRMEERDMTSKGGTKHRKADHPPEKDGATSRTERHGQV